MRQVYVMAADAGYELPLAVAMASLVEHHHGAEIVVLDGGVLARARASIDRFLAGRAGVQWLPVDERLLAGTESGGRLPITTNYRLLLPRLLPDVDRVIYLDADTVVTGSFGDLVSQPLGEAVLAGVRDAGTPFAAGASGPDWRLLELAPDTPYFNAGMLVWPLEPWRDGVLAERALRVLRDLKPRWGDQDALNAAVAGNWLQLPGRYNVQLGDVTGRTVSWALWPDSERQALADPVLVHFNGHRKPWHSNCNHPWRERWWQALGRTPWRGYTVPRPRPFAGWSGRVRAAVAGEVAGLRRP